jgi:hypothetical protein
MRRFLFVAAAFVVGLAVFAQELQHEAISVNIEVPVRVYKGTTFVDSLTIEDFEVYEEGVLQKIEAVYLIKKTDIEREEIPGEEQQRSVPETSRNLVLMFEINDYLPEVDDAIGYFFESVIAPGDTLIVSTPEQQYNLKSEALQNMPMADIERLVKERVQNDVRVGRAHYHNLVRQIRSILLEELEGADFTLEERLPRIYDLYNEWKSLRYVEEENLVKFANYLKETDKQKHVFVFYQKEVLPAFSPKKMTELEYDAQETPYLLAMAHELFSFDRINISLDINRVKEAFSDSSITSHFLYITKNQPYEMDVTSRQGTLAGGVVMDEVQTEVSVIFKEMAQATGGLVESSLNAASAFKKAVDASENYYLLFYSPKSYAADGKFKNIRVRVKSGNYRVTFRAGYISD